MNPIDPKLVARARWLRPDLAQRLVAMKATQAGRGILIKPASGDPMPVKPPLPATPNATAVKAALLQKVVHGTSDAPRELAVEAYREEGARTVESASRARLVAQEAPAADRPAAQVSEAPGRPIPFALAALPPRPDDVEEYSVSKQNGQGREGSGDAKRSRGGRTAEKPQIGRLALGLLLMLAILAGLALLAL